MLQRPAAAVVICIDVGRAVEYGLPATNSGLLIDVGTAAQTMLLAAHALDLGSGPVTSFSKAAVSTVLNLPARWSPELVVCLGHAATTQPSPVGPHRRLTWRDLSYWGRLDRNANTAAGS
jgi:nitroreductase